MFEVIFEVHPRSTQFDAYLSLAGSLKPILESQRGFLANVRYKSLTRPGWILSLSDWADEKSLVRWRTQGGHHAAQEKGRNQVLEDYHLRVGEVTHDEHVEHHSESDSHRLAQSRLDVTEVGEAKAMTLINLRLEPPATESGDAADRPRTSEVLRALEFDPATKDGIISWDAFEAILTPGSLLLMCAWKSMEAAQSVTRSSASLTAAHRIRHVRIVRDYGMFDRIEAPQYYPQVQRAGLDLMEQQVNN